MGRLTAEEYRKLAAENGVEVDKDKELDFDDIINASLMMRGEYRKLNTIDLSNTNVNGLKETTKLPMQIMTSMIFEMVKANPSKKNFLYEALNESFKNKGVEVKITVLDKESDILKAFNQPGYILARMANSIKDVGEQPSFFASYMEAKRKTAEKGLLDIEKIQTPIVVGELPPEDNTHFTVKQRLTLSDVYQKGELKDEMLDDFATIIAANRKQVADRNADEFSPVHMTGGAVDDDDREVRVSVTEALRRSKTAFNISLGKDITIDKQPLVSHNGFCRSIRTIKHLQIVHNNRPWYKKLAGVFGGEAGKETKLINEMKKELMEVTKVSEKDLNDILAKQNFHTQSSCEELLEKDENLNVVSNEKFADTIREQTMGHLCDSIVNQAGADIVNEAVNNEKHLKSLDNLALDTGAVDVSKKTEGPSQNFEDPTRNVEFGK